MGKEISDHELVAFEVAAHEIKNTNDFFVVPFSAVDTCSSTNYWLFSAVICQTCQSLLMGDKTRSFELRNRILSNALRRIQSFVPEKGWEDVECWTTGMTVEIHIGGQTPEYKKAPGAKAESLEAEYGLWFHENDHFRCPEAFD